MWSIIRHVKVRNWKSIHEVAVNFAGKYQLEGSMLQTAYISGVSLSWTGWIPKKKLTIRRSMAWARFERVPPLYIINLTYLMQMPAADHQALPSHYLHLYEILSSWQQKEGQVIINKYVWLGLESNEPSLLVPCHYMHFDADTHRGPLSLPILISAPV
jgi:hypothetical protein